MMKTLRKWFIVLLALSLLLLPACDRISLTAITTETVTAQEGTETAKEACTAANAAAKGKSIVFLIALSLLRAPLGYT